ncbi:MAG: DNA-directed RNA polymerase subunit L [Candidatus Methanohalarchaeum thermophilum]|uniref:DNA-directed RNA polymerase subunit Rpo11 n=1 Tax=Methanohalarchaeum thermophilum TaxID=1903181 RepID=A0A1Q6DXW9_METT1|nr:MAG: DNA-directed RNA polymerase subunit L [Candidatus Methanohalarchaeum thermophilum]
MEIDVKKKNKNEMEIELIGEDHTLANLLKEELLSDSRVQIASYNKEHPELSNPVLHVKTKKEDPKEVIDEITEDLIKSYENLNQEFKEINK